VCVCVCVRACVKEIEVSILFFSFFTFILLGKSVKNKFYFNKPNAIVNLRAGGSTLGPRVCQKYVSYFHSHNYDHNSCR
jgi:hypothetical protein